MSSYPEMAQAVPLNVIVAGQFDSQMEIDESLARIAIAIITSKEASCPSDRTDNTPPALVLDV
jgi:hypothetical protein